MMKLLPTISDIIFLPFTMFPCKFNLLRVKHNFVFKLPHELLTDLRRKILGNWERQRKSQNCVETQTSIPKALQKLVFGNNAQNLRESR